MPLNSTCVFCRLAPAFTGFKTLRTFDYRGVPARLINHVQQLVRDGFFACSECAPFVRAKDQPALFERAHSILSIPVASHEEEFPLLQALTTAALTQEIFWLGLTTDFGKTVAIAKHVSSATQLWFNMLQTGLPNADHAVFRNGVELWAWPLGDTLHLEEIRSRQAGNGHASDVMNYVAAAADKFEVTLLGTVEAHKVSTVPRILADDQLYAWYERIGFRRREGLLPNAIVREPGTAVSAEDRDSAYTIALNALTGKSA